MASIIIMRSDEFLKSFINTYNYENYNFILVSSDITTSHKFKNVFRIKQLLPPTKAISCKLNGNDNDEYYKKYVKHLMRPDIEIYMTTIAKLVIGEDSNVVIMCSKDEDDSIGYLKILKDYFEEIYKLKVYTYKKYKKDKDPNSAVNKKKTLKIIAKKLKIAAENGTEANIDMEEFVGRLKHMKKKTVYEFAKSRGIKVNKNMDKSEIIKKIMKKLQ